MKNHQLFFWMIVVLFNIKLPIEVKCQPVLEWENKFDLENRSDESFKMLLDNEGNIYNAGTSFNIFTKNEIVYFKLNSNGFQEWFQDVSNFYFDDITDYAIDGSNDLYVTGYYTDSFFYTNGFIQKTNSSGTYLWGDTTGFVVFESIAIDDSNNVYALYSDFAVGITKYDSSGQIKFNVRNDSTLNGNFVLPWIITLDPANNIYVSGTSTLESDDEYMLKKFSSGGNFLWGVTYNPTEEDDRPRFVSIDEYSNIYIYGVIGGGDPGQGVALVKFDSSGNFLWDQQI
ncbi:MAG: hypothetical protein LH473_06700, partial [Chitinophagales bacterium]|nr:hypothetical protein [Chitinophagales bacterium]